MENYIMLEKIGEGSFGRVYRGRRKYTGQIVALKFVAKRGKTPRDIANLRQEVLLGFYSDDDGAASLTYMNALQINILRRLSHCNIIAILDSFETDSEFCMVTEYGLGELFEVLQGDLSLPESEIRHITIQLLQALQVLHSKRIIHRDMKPQNILIGSKQQIKLCDFGFARAISQESSVLTSIKGTPLYMAPELVQEKPYNCTVDLWSLGVILYELAVGTPPFYTDRFVTLVDMIIKQPVTFPETMSPPFRSFLAGLLTKDPQKRLSWPHILHHEFVVETPAELQRRLELEQACQQLPRFFSSAEHVPVESKLQLRPSVERLRNSGEWNICDPETGKRVQNVLPQQGAKDTATIVATKQTESRDPRAPETVTAPEIDDHKHAVEFMTLHQELTEHLQDKKGMSVLELADWVSVFESFLKIPSATVTHECLAAATSDAVAMYKALAAIMKNINQVQSISQILAARGIIQSVSYTLAARDKTIQDMASHEASAELLFQAVRCCTMFTNVVNSLDPAIIRDLDYRSFCSSDLRLVTKILKLSGDQFNAALSKTLKWLGSMLDRTRNLTDFLEKVQPSGVIEALCEVLARSSGKRSPGGTSTKSARDLGLYAVFALATFVHPDGSKWGPLHSFPVMTLRRVDDAQDDSAAADVHHLYKLRVKVHGEVTTQLLRNGLQELLALLNDEFKARVARSHAGEEDDDVDEEPDQSTVSCVIKILLHACRSSSPLSRKIIASKTGRAPSPSQQDVVTIVIGLIQSSTLHDLEMYFAVEFLVVLIRRQVLSKPQVWICAKVLYPIFRSTSDVGLLSLCCTYYSDVLESSSMDTTALNRNEQALGLEIGDQDVWNLVLHGVLPEVCANSVLRLLHHEHFAALPHQDQLEKLQILSCYNVRAQGLADAGIVLLLRVAAKALSQAATSDTTQGADTRALQSFMRLFESSATWDLLRQFLGDCGNNLMSPWGLFCFLKLVRMVREMPASDLVVEVQLNQQLVPQLVSLLQTGHMQALFKWPEVVAGGRNAVKALIHAIVKVLGIPFMHSQSNELLVSTQETLYDSTCVHKLLTVLRYVVTTPEFGLDESLLELPMSFLSRLVTSSEHFGSQFVETGGVATIKVCGMLHTRSSPSLMIDTLLILSQLARSSPENYECILEAGLLTEFRDMVSHNEAMVRAKALNCIGNLCRHSTLFYDSFSSPISGIHGSLSVLDGVVSGLSDPDAYVRRFACFAIGNAAFHSSQLYASLRLSIDPLVQNLHDNDEKTRSNAAGALGNLVRNSNELCGDMCRHHAPLELFELALTDPSVSSRRIVLFSLGNFCAYAACLESILHEEPDLRRQLETLYEEVETDEVSKKNIRRILAKVDALQGVVAGPEQ